MKKVMLVMLVMLLSVVFAGGVFAQDRDPKEEFNKKLAMAKVMTFEGTVLSHDVACHCIVVKGAKSNLTVQDDYTEFNQDYNRAKGLMIGSKVKVTYKTVDYINYATKIQ